MTPQQKRRGRPKIHDDGAILDSALRVFATHGYEGMSMRSLNSELGLSHGTINQRFGTKEQLYLDAIDHGFSLLLSDMTDILGREDLPDDPLEELRVRFRAFLLASFRQPHLNRIINNEGVNPSAVLDHIFERYIVPAMRPTRRLMGRLEAAGRILPQTDRAILFLLANGAGSLYSLTALSKKFDRIDGAADGNHFADAMATLLVNGMRKIPQDAKSTKSGTTRKTGHGSKTTTKTTDRQPAKRASSSRKT